MNGYPIRTAAAAALILTLALAAPAARCADELRSLEPSKILGHLDLTGPGLEDARAAAEAGNRPEALEALLGYYREKYPQERAMRREAIGELKEANLLANHIFQWGPYEPAYYGKETAEIDWAADPRGDIEWVAAVYRFYWARTLADAYAITGDEKYAETFVDLTADWIRKHPLEERDVAHPVYTHWRGYPWLDIQTGIRAQSLCSAFKVFVHAKAFTPEFLGVFLASLYDHQAKTERFPMNQIHNKAIFEQRGFIAIAAAFPEFKESDRWLRLAAERTGDNLLKQTTKDGVQREWSGGYHLGVLRDAAEIMQTLESAGAEVSAAYRERVRAMYDYIFYIATPDLAFPMFGDYGRPETGRSLRPRWPLYGVLKGASELLDDPKYAALADLNREALPETGSHAFSDAGMYVMRNDWGPQQIYMALHCSPPAISSHDQPDNGTFELYAHGRWLLTDSGYYTYGHDPEGRAWHRQTKVHQTLTLNGGNAKVDGRELLWKSGPGFDALTVENPSYPGLTHRRTVWFVDRSFFVLLDEAIGNADGALDLHFQLPPGEMPFDAAAGWIATPFNKGNVLIQRGENVPAALAEEEEGWFAWKYGERVPRPAFRYRHRDNAPAWFLTLVVPHEGAARPAASVRVAGSFQAGGDRVEIEAEAFGKRWAAGRDLSAGEAWCRELES